MKGTKVMVAETPSGNPVCIMICYGSQARAEEQAAILTRIGIPAWNEEEA